jgi:hypothetical protein
VTAVDTIRRAGNGGFSATLVVDAARFRTTARGFTADAK